MDFGGVALMAEDLFIAAWNLVESSGVYRDFLIYIHLFLSERKMNRFLWQNSMLKKTCECVDTREYLEAIKREHCCDISCGIQKRRDTKLLEKSFLHYTMTWPKFQISQKEQAKLQTTKMTLENWLCDRNVKRENRLIHGEFSILSLFEVRLLSSNVSNWLISNETSLQSENT